MIESLRRSESRFLALFAICTFGLGVAVGFMVRLFQGTAIAVSSGGLRLREWDRDSLAMSAATASTRVAVISLLLWVLSFVVLALSLMNEAGSSQGVVRVLARTLYVLSFIAMIAAVCAAVVFMMCQA